MTVENANPAPEEEITIEITEDTAQGGEQEGDELERYTKSVSKRINKLNAKTREAESRAQQYEAMLAQQQQELAQYKQMAVQSQVSSLQAEEDKLKAQEQQVEDIYKKAVQSQDADLMSKADTLKNDIAIKKEKLRVAKSRQQPQENYQPMEQMAPQQQMQPQQEEPQPTQEALSWHEKNPWYGDSENEENVEATQFAYFTHYNLINEGYEPDSDEYYDALDNRVARVYPNLSKSVGNDTDAAEKTGRQPAVQRVASAQPSGRPQTRGKKNGVQFTSSELERLRGLKPHNMTEEAWLKAVAKEKQKVAQREAR
jgi:glutamate synthase domain-containing protein 2